MKTIYIMAGGPEEMLPDLGRFEKPSLWAAADKGVSSLLKRGIEPDAAFGDFDSIEEGHRSFEAKETYTYEEEKDETDLALALAWGLGQNPGSITVFGGTGGRMDHTMGVIHLLVEERFLQSGIAIKVIDRQNEIEAKLPGRHTVRRDGRHKYISFLPVTPIVEGMTLEGFKYPLQGKEIRLGSTLCLSNELISDIGTYSFTSGILMVIRSND